MEIADTIFKRKTYDKRLLINYGFVERNNRLEYSTQILNGQFLFIVKINQNAVLTDVIEVSSYEPFILYHIDGASGAFVGQLKGEAEKILTDICEKCFSKEVFKSEQTKFVLRYAKDKYSTNEEYLWDTFPENAVLRRSDNKKWYAALLTVEKKKLGLDGEGTVEVIDLRGEPDDISAIVDGKNYFRGYHMNKVHWYTVCLNYSVTDEELKARIDKSYLLTR